MAGKLIRTPSQTVGPFFHLGMARAEWGDLTAEGPAGEQIAIEGRVIDGDGMPVPDALVELWQANAAGRYNHPDDQQTDKPLDPHFRGFGRVATDAEGRFRVVTIKPGPPRHRHQPGALPFRHRPPGRERNRLPRHLSPFARRWADAIERPIMASIA